MVLTLLLFIVDFKLGDRGDLADDKVSLVVPLYWDYIAFGTIDPTEDEQTSLKLSDVYAKIPLVP